MSSFPKNQFDAATLDLLEGVLETACQSRSFTSSTWDEAIRRLYAGRIFSRAAAGERDPARLLTYALVSLPANSD